MTAKPVDSVQSLFFSPTGSTRRIVEAIARGTGVPSLAPISVTTPYDRDSFSGQIDGDLLIVGVPVYTGRIPSFVLSPLSQVDGTGRWALPVAVCGNVRMGTCLAELCAILKRQGFTIPAAGNFIAQHSFASEDFPIAEGRPDEDDLRQAVEFGRRVADKIAQDPEDITSVYRGYLNIRMYVSGSTEATGFVSMGAHHRATIRVSEHNAKLCDDCGACVGVCPTGAIDPESYLIEEETCIRCFACTSVCAPGAKTKIVQPVEELALWFTHRSTERGEPLLFF
ncbi:MAG: 4Fe-4S binding protein [Anaerolineae bacterium]